MNRFNLRMNEMPPEGGGALGGATGTPPVEAAPVADAPVANELYGELDVKWPEAFDDGLKSEALLAPFINKESGEVEVANLLKSYTHTKRMVGSNKTTLPTENSTDLEKQEFWEKLGYVRDENEYKMDRAEDSLLDEALATDLKTFARENHMPLETAKKMMGFLEGQAKTVSERETTAGTEGIQAGLDGLKTEYGMAYESNLNVAKRVLSEVVQDESVMEAMNDPRVGSNPAVIKALVSIGKKVFAEDGLKGTTGDGLISPDDATRKINEIMADKKGAYWNNSHPDHNRIVKEVNGLYTMKSPQR